MSVSDRVTSAWGQFSHAATGKALPITGIEDFDGLFLIVHECDPRGPPIECRDGTMVRRLALSFDIGKEEVVWN